VALAFAAHNVLFDIQAQAGDAGLWNSMISIRCILHVRDMATSDYSQALHEHHDE